ncbi:MAG: hypothetical protein BWX52_01977 [Bacteroidetes bacterium ADurb.Bin013]|nr:MAG: hypothetical protein BWX52_01977 [Bacteroidetes bacterium ADurb.Bin013]
MSSDEARDFEGIGSCIFAVFFDEWCRLVTACGKVERATSAYDTGTDHEVVVSGGNPWAISGNELGVAAHAGVSLIDGDGDAVGIIAALNHTDIEVTTGNSNGSWECKFDPSIMSRCNFYSSQFCIRQAHCTVVVIDGHGEGLEVGATGIGAVANMDFTAYDLNGVGVDGSKFQGVDITFDGPSGHIFELAIIIDDFVRALRQSPSNIHCSLCRIQRGINNRGRIGIFL